MINRIQLRDDIVIAFNEEELRQFCRRFGMTYKDLSGNTQRDRVGVLIGKLDRQQRLPELVEELMQERPHLANRYAAMLQGMAEPANRDERLNWLDRVAGGMEMPVDEQPTLSWKTQVSSHGQITGYESDGAAPDARSLGE